MIQAQKTAIVLFAHGARDARWARPLEHLKRELQRRQPQLRVDVAFLELQTPDLAEAMTRIASDGFAQIHVAPVFWSMGGHSARDLPALIGAFGAQHPGIRVEVLPVLAELPGMNDFLARTMLALSGFGPPERP